MAFGIMILGSALTTYQALSLDYVVKAFCLYLIIKNAII